MKRILIVDDEKDFGTMIGRAAAGAGYAVTVTSSPRAFMDSYAQVDPDVIVMDIVMPEMDGIELMQWLIAQGCRARIIVLSGFNPTYANMAKTIGEVKGHLSVSFLPKPVAIADLRAALA